MTKEQKLQYVANLSDEALIVEFSQATLSNDYGSHTEYLTDLRAEMLRRMSH